MSEAEQASGCDACDKEQKRTGERQAKCNACEIEYLEWEIEVAKNKIARLKYDSLRAR